jgi:hypothetical protein
LAHLSLDALKRYILKALMNTVIIVRRANCI